MLQFLQNQKDKILSIIEKCLIVAFLVLLGITVHKIYERYNNKSNISSNIINVTPTTNYKDKDNTTHNVIVTREISQIELDYITDSIRRSIKGNVQIKEIVKVVPQIDTVWRDLPIVIKGDTIEISKVDSYVSAKAIIDLQTKQGDISLSLTDTLTEARTFKNRLLRANIETIDITNTNPYVNVNAGTSILSKEPKSLLVFGPTIVYNPFTQKMQYGIGATFNILSLKSKK